MKWFSRITGTLLLLAALAVLGAWLAFPWYAQTLVDRATAGKAIAVKLHRPGLPGLWGIGFGQLDAMIRVKPDSCSTTASTYEVTLRNGRLSWRRIAGSATPALALQLDADDVSVRQMPSEIRFRQANPSLRARIDFRDADGLLPTAVPDSVAVEVRRGQAETGKLRLEEISYNVLLTRSRNWVQQPARFSAKSLFSGSAKTPLSNFEATFGLQRDHRKPCTLKFSDCSVELFGVRASTPEVEYSLRNKRTAFVLELDNVPLERLSTASGQATLTGEVSGSVPVEYLGSSIRIENGIVDAAKGAAMTMKTGNTTIAFDAGREPGGPPFIGNLNVKVTLDATSGAVSAIRLDSLSARLFGGRIESTPARYDLESGKAAATIKIDNAPILDRIRLQGDFSGAMNGRISGAVPIRLGRDGIAISNAWLSAQGGGTIRQKLPRQATSDAEALFPKSASTEVLWTFGDPVVTLNREAAGRLRIDAALKSIERKTGSGELLLASPKGSLTMFDQPGNPALITLSDFSAKLLDGTVAIERMEYNLDTKRAETVVQLNGIPIQSLLDLQGASKLSATGTIRAAIPLVLDNGAFSIPDGSMDAEKSGLIIYASTPEERAAAGAGLRLTYEALGNFFYSELVSTITMTPDGDSMISIQLKGRNPDFQENRPVNLNLNIQQNLLDLLRSLTLASEIEEEISKKVLEKSGGKNGEK